MSKTIKLEDSVYTRLETFRNKRETFSASVDRLLDTSKRVGELLSQIEGSLKYAERQSEQLKQMSEAK